MAVIQEDVKLTKYWTMWWVALVQFHLSVVRTEQTGGHSIYTGKTLQVIGRPSSIVFDDMYCFFLSQTVLVSVCLLHYQHLQLLIETLVSVDAYLLYCRSHRYSVNLYRVELSVY